jgi:hypothetical protein
MAPVIAGLPERLTEKNVTRPELLVHRHGPVGVYYTPFDWVNTRARMVLVGICPGRQQMRIAVQEARRVLVTGGTVGQALKAADATASFAGPTRRNLVQMLDGIGAHHALGIASAASLFGEHQDLADSSSMCNFTVQVNGKNYGGRSPQVDQVPFLAAYVRQVLGAALEMTPSALVVPLGQAVSTAVRALLIEEGRLDPRRCLLGFPHPSGQNGHRVPDFQQARRDLAARVRAWFSEAGRSTAPLAVAHARAPATAVPTSASHQARRGRGRRTGKAPSAAGRHVDSRRSGDMADWIFQATPKTYDVHAAVAESPADWWNTPRRRNVINIGDRVWLQVAGPNSPGIYYVATVVSLPYEAEPSDPERPNFGRWRTDIRYDYSLDLPLLRTELLDHPRLGSFWPFRGFQGSNALVPPDVATKLSDLVTPRFVSLGLRP